MKILWVLVAAIAIIAVGVIAQSDVKEPIRDGVFIHVTHGTDDPHRALMALTMAEIMSEDHDVLVYFDITGIEVVLKDAPDIQFKEFKSSKTQLQILVARKVTLMACPLCLNAAGKTEADLAPDIKIADKQQFFSFTKGRILTVDY